MTILGSLRVLLGTNVAQYETDMGKAAAITRKAAKEIASAGRDLNALASGAKSVGAALTAGLTLPILASATAAARAAITWESAFAGVRKTVNATKEELDKLGLGIRAMAQQIPVSADKLAGIAQSAGQLGIAKENILGFTRVVADLAVATNLTAEQGAQDLARLANITKMPQTEFSNLGSAVVYLGNNFATTESEIVAMALRLAGAGSQVGLTTPQIVGMAAALSSVGIEAEAGGSAFSKVMKDMALAVQKGGQELKDFADVAAKGGVRNFAETFGKDPQAAITSFIRGLAKIKEEGGSVIGVLDRMGITEVRMSSAILNSAGAYETMGKAMSGATAAAKENTALQKEAAARYATTQSQLEILKNKLTDVAITFGNALLPAIRSGITLLDALLPSIRSVGDAFAKLPGGVQLTVLALVGLAAAAGPAIFVVGSMVGAVGNVLTLFGKLALTSAGLKFAGMIQGLGGVQGAVATLGIGLGGLLIVFAKIAAAFAVGWAVGTLIRNIGGVGEAVDKLVLKLQGVDLKKLDAGDVDRIARNLAIIQANLAKPVTVTAKAPPPPVAPPPVPLTDDQRKAIAAITAELAKLKAVHQGTYAAAVADIKAAIAARVQEAKGVAAIIGPLRQLQALQIEAAKQANIRSIFGAAPGDAAAKLKDIAQALKDVGGVSALTRSELEGLAKSLEAVMLAGGTLTSDQLGLVQWAAEARDVATAYASISAALEKGVATGRKFTELMKKPPAPVPEGPEAVAFWLDGIPYEKLSQIPKDAADATKEFRSWQTELAGALHISEGMLANIIAIGQAFASIVSDNAKMDKSGRPLSEQGYVGAGAQKGFAAGSQTGNPLITAIATFAGAIAGMIAFAKRPEWVKVMEDVGARWGAAISEGLAKEIEKTKHMFVGLSTYGAELLHLSDIMAASDRKASSFSHDVLNLLFMIDRGTVPAAEGIAEVGKAFAAMAEEAEAAGGRASQAMGDIIHTVELLGIVVPEVQQYIVDKFTELVEVSTQLLQSWTEQFEAGTMSLDDFQRHVERSAAQVYAMFTRLLAQGVSMIDVFRQLGPLIDEIAAAAEAGGKQPGTPGGSTERIFELNELFKKHKQFFDDFNLELQQLQLELDTFILTPAGLDQYMADVNAYYEQLLAWGFTADEALAIIAPYLIAGEQAARRFGVALDPTTQNLLDLAHAGGQIKTDPMDKMAGTLNVIADLLAAMVEAVGGTLPQSWLLARDAANQYGDTVRGLPVLPGGRDEDTGEPTNPHNPGPPPGYGRGGFAPGPASGHWELLHGPEVVVAKEMFGRLLYIPPQGGPAVPVPPGRSRGWIPDSLPLPEPPSLPRAARGSDDLVGPVKAVLDVAMGFARSGPPVDVQAIVAELVATRAVMARVVGDLATRPVSVQVDGREIVRTVIDVGIRGDGELLSASRDGLGGRRRG